MLLSPLDDDMAVVGRCYLKGLLWKSWRWKCGSRAVGSNGEGWNRIGKAGIEKELYDILFQKIHIELSFSAFAGCVLISII